MKPGNKNWKRKWKCKLLAVVLPARCTDCNYSHVQTLSHILDCNIARHMSASRSYWISYHKAQYRSKGKAHDSLQRVMTKHTTHESVKKTLHWCLVFFFWFPFPISISSFHFQFPLCSISCFSICPKAGNGNEMWTGNGNRNATS